MVVTLVAVAANGFSGVAALVRFRPILPGMIRAGVPESWVVFPIGTLKLAGAVGLLVALFGIEPVGIAAAAGLVLFFVCAVYTHVLVSDYSPQIALALAFLALNSATLALTIAS